MKSNYLCKVNELEKLTDTIYMLEIDKTCIKEEILPGQFFHIKCGEGYLRRPISVCDVEGNVLKVAFEVRGKGTHSLATLKKGDEIDILGPLGNGFKLGYERICVVGGGIGVFPLLYLLKKSKSKNKDAILGFMCSDKVVLENEFEGSCDNLIITCDDGSYGIKGFVTVALAKYLENNKVDIVYTCGPEVMMKKVNELCIAHRVPCQISLEERMGCGIGACLVCSCGVKSDDEVKKVRVCKDGPCMWGHEVYYD